jgi:phosphatidylinositol-3,4,5-trisphosphate 3-phosphatase and dual-specificity protein phosphatase PTEN
MHAWLSADPENVVAVHCKAGKGRTGLVISAYLVHAGIAPSTSAALRMFGDVRTHDGKGVTIPSQMRYVHYYEASMRAAAAGAAAAGAGAGAGDAFHPAVYLLRAVRLHTVPNFDVGGGSDPYFDVRLGDGKSMIFNMLAAAKGKVKHYGSKARVVDLDVSAYNVRVKGDVKMVFYDYDQMSAPDKMFHLWFNTGFIQNNYLLFHKDVLDRACKDKACKEFEPDFKVELFLDRVEEVAGEFDALDSEYLDADNDEDMDEDGEGDGGDDK